MPHYTLKQAAALLQAKECSAVELAGAYLDDIARHAELNAFITVDPEHTLTEARAADTLRAARSGRPAGRRSHRA